MVEFDHSVHRHVAFNLDTRRRSFYKSETSAKVLCKSILSSLTYVHQIYNNSALLGTILNTAVYSSHCHNISLFAWHIFNKQYYLIRVTP